MLNPKAHLAENLFDSPEQAPTRDGFGKGLVEAGENDPCVVALCADLAESTRVHWFREKFPERYVELGVAEQNLATVASGMANYGKIPFIASYATFSPGRNNEQIRTCCALAELPVKIAGCHAGLTVGPDGATHQALEDIALMRVQPNMVVVAPADAEEARKATLAIAQNGKPSYLRLGRSKTPQFTTPHTPFEIGKAEIFWRSENPQVTLVACGPLVHTALLAAKELEQSGVGSIVVNSHTVKPLDEKTLCAVAQETGAVVTIEEHQIAGGMGSAIAELLAQNHPVPVEFIGVRDQFGQSGEPEELLTHYGLNAPAILAAAKKVIERKNDNKCG